MQVKVRNSLKNLALLSRKEVKSMYKKQSARQMSFEDFNQPAGLKMNPNNRWVKKADLIPWSEFELEYASEFTSDTGNVAKSFRVAFGALVIQQEYGYSDAELVNQIQENPYYQYFIGLPGYQDEKAFDSSSLVHFRKRLTAERLMKINERIIQLQLDSEVVENQDAPSSDDDDDDKPNSGTLILDATCVPQEIKYPTDSELLNESRVQAEKIIDAVCENHGYEKPRIYRRDARAVYLNIVRRKKKSKSFLRKNNRKLLNYVKRNIKVINGYLSDGIKLDEKQLQAWQTINLIYDQQLYMFENKTNSVPDRIVSFSQPWIRPIVRGKTKTNVEFGAKIDVSVEKGYARLEKASFDAYNESTVLQDCINGFYNRNGHYPERVLVDKIYRNRDNIKFCKEKGIRISGPSLGRPAKDAVRNKAVEKEDNADRIEVERSFSLMKRRFGMDKNTAKLEDTTLTKIAMSILY